MRKTKAQISLPIRAVWSAPLLFTTSSFYIQNFKPPASLCSWIGRFEYYLVKNPEDRVSRDEANLLLYGLTMYKEGIRYFNWWS